jgi:hypothetical protein
MPRAASALVACALSVAFGLALAATVRAEDAPVSPEPEAPPEPEAVPEPEAPPVPEVLTEPEPPVPARVEGRGAGALSGHVLLRNAKDPDLGGAALFDLWFTDGALRIGAALGLAFVAGEDDQDRLFAPLGASLAVGSKPRPVGFALRLRGGGWTGATNGGFAGGGWLAAGFYIEYALDPRLAIAAGMDAWFLFGHGDTTIFAPGVSLVWSGARE